MTDQDDALVWLPDSEVSPEALLRAWVTATALRDTDPGRFYRRLLLREYPWFLGRN